jgi:DNA-directed RNA polymerase specialized sigma24 family protein
MNAQSLVLSSQTRHPLSANDTHPGAPSTLAAEPSATLLTSDRPKVSAQLDHTSLRNTLIATVGKKVPAHDVEDVVQGALAEALASQSAPADPEAFRKWLWGLVRHKVADYHRGRRFEREDPDTLHAEPAAHDANNLYQWASARLPQTEGVHETFSWLLREGDGETLEDIAREEAVPPARVRKRVSRLRAHLRDHWKQELALLAAVGVLGIAVWWFLRKDETPVANPQITPDVTPNSPEKVEPREAKKLHDLAKERCDRKDYRGCLQALDEADKLVPGGKATPENDAMRKRALELLKLQDPLPIATSVVPAEPDRDALSRPGPKPLPSSDTPAPKVPPPSFTSNWQAPTKPGPAKPGPKMPTGGKAGNLK